MLLNQRIKVVGLAFSFLKKGKKQGIKLLLGAEGKLCEGTQKLCLGVGDHTSHHTVGQGFHGMKSACCTFSSATKMTELGARPARLVLKLCP